eukprot:237727_1
MNKYDVAVFPWKDLLQYGYSKWVGCLYNPTLVWVRFSDGSGNCKAILSGELKQLLRQIQDLMRDMFDEGYHPSLMFEYATTGILTEEEVDHLKDMLTDIPGISHIPYYLPLGSRDFFERGKSLLLDEHFLKRAYSPMARYLLEFYVLSSYTRKRCGVKRARPDEPDGRPAKKVRRKFRVKTGRMLVRSCRKSACGN